MTRREFTAGTAGIAIRNIAGSIGTPAMNHRVEIYVSPSGDDKNPGVKEKPVATLQKAQLLARQARRQGYTVTVYLRKGIHYLPSPLIFTAEDSGTADAPITYKAFDLEHSIVSGGVRLDLSWTPYRDGIFSAKVPAGMETDQLFVNGKRQFLARYPNYDPAAKYFDGFAEDAFSHERAARWADPTGGFIHAMHPALWGDFHYRITGKDASGNVTYEGGWQNNRPSPMHKSIRFVENIFEELDSPEEWYLNSKTDTLYYYPPPEVDIKRALVEAVRLRSLVEFQGNAQNPVRNVHFEGLMFRHTTRTFMETREPILRTDWATYRGGAIFLRGTEDCEFEDCTFDQMGGNVIFASEYNRRLTLRGCEITEAGGNGICLIGDPKAVRSPLFNYDQSLALADIDRIPGPKTNNYPSDCLVEDCLIHRTGRVEKQTAPIEIDMAQDITIRHCSLYDVPRAGINIGDGCWGGHIIEHCDIFDTVKETGDHGSYNSWGRDRYWLPSVQEFSKNVRDTPALPYLDVVKPIVLRNNRWRCDHGWDIDLDDGSSNYEITHNLCLRGGIKNREGYKRIVRNNITVNNSFHLHVWPENSADVYRSNIVFAPYRPIGMPPKPWGEDFDNNFVHVTGTPTEPATVLQAQSGRDTQSLTGDALFVDPSAGNFAVRDGSPALNLGFENFPMTLFGVRGARLRSIARQPVFGESTADAEDVHREDNPHAWEDATVRNIVDRNEMSAYGLPGVTGVLVIKVTEGSTLDKIGVKRNDVIIGLDERRIGSVDDLLQPMRRISFESAFKITVFRLQKVLILSSATARLP